MIRIFNSEHDAITLTAAIEDAEGIPRSGTTEWGQPRKHPTQDLWAVVLSDLSPVLETDIPYLSLDWYPEEIL